MSAATPDPSVPEPPPPPAYGQAAAWGPPGRVRGILACIGLAIITLGIYTFVWVWKTQEEIKQHSHQGVGGPLGFVIYFVIAPVTWFLLPHEVEKMVKQAGRPSRVSALTGLWILLPIIGAFVWFTKVQGQLNDYWRSLGVPG